MSNLLDSLRGDMLIVDHAHRAKPEGVDEQWFKNKREGQGGVNLGLMTAMHVANGIAPFLVTRGVRPRTALRLEKEVRDLLSDLMRDWSPTVVINPDMHLVETTPRLFRKLERIAARFRDVPSEATASSALSAAISPKMRPREFRPANFFPKKMHGRLRHAASPQRTAKRVASKKEGGVTFYCVDDARRWWPNECPPTGGA